MNLRLWSCVVRLNRREAPRTDIFLGVRVRSTSEPQSLRTAPADLQVFLLNCPVSSRVNPRSFSRDDSCSASSLDLTEMHVHTVWKKSSSQLKHIMMDEEWKQVQDKLHYRASHVQCLSSVMTFRVKTESRMKYSILLSVIKKTVLKYYWIITELRNNVHLFIHLVHLRI